MENGEWQEMKQTERKQTFRHFLFGLPILGQERHFHGNLNVYQSIISLFVALVFVLHLIRVRLSVRPKALGPLQGEPLTWSSSLPDPQTA